MTPPRLSGGLAAVARAEFLKIWASRIPAIVIAVLPAGTWLFAVELYHAESLAEHRPDLDAFGALPLLFFAAWKTLLFQAAMLAFGAFWTALDSQYGMIRVAACQPITRVEHLAGKWLAIAAHVVLCTAVFVGSLVCWAGLYSGFGGYTPDRWRVLVRFGAEVIVFTVALTLIASAAASLRRTVGAGLITAALTVIGLAFMTMLPFEVLAPHWVLMRYFGFPLGELPNPFPANGDSPFNRVHSVGQFARTAALTTAAFVVPALVHYRRRDIVE